METADSSNEKVELTPEQAQRLAQANEVIPIVEAQLASAKSFNEKFGGNGFEIAKRESELKYWQNIVANNGVEVSEPLQLQPYPQTERQKNR